MLQVLQSGTASAEENMSIDARLLEALDPAGEPLLRLYRWEGLSATYGYFSAPEQHLDLDGAARHRLSLARRPTGGGIVFHIWDLAFSFLMPSAHPRFSLNTLENYRFVNGAVLEAMKEFFSLRESVEMIPVSALATEGCSHFCMARPTQYDVVHKGMKIAGAAQRKRKQGYLHQGTISLAAPQEELLNAVLLSKEVLASMLNYTFAPLGPAPEPAALEKARAEIEALLAQKFMAELKRSR